MLGNSQDLMAEVTLERLKVARDGEVIGNQEEQTGWLHQWTAARGIDGSGRMVVDDVDRTRRCKVDVAKSR